jgi:hypothetical protein
VVIIARSTPTAWLLIQQLRQHRDLDRDCASGSDRVGTVDHSKLIVGEVEHRLDAILFDVVG